MKISCNGIPIFEFSHVELNDIFLIVDKYYLIEGIDYNQEMANAIEINKNDNPNFSPYITCPVCGFVKENEIDEEPEDDICCERCGSIYAFYTITTIQYQTTLVKLPTIKTI